MATNFIRLHPDVARGILLRSDATSAAPAVPLFQQADRFWGRLCTRRSFQSALTLSSFVLPDGVAALQNGSDVGLPTFFAAANCGSVSANWRCCYAVLCASWNSSRCDFVFVDRSGADRCNLFLEIGSETMATHHRAAFLLFAPLVQHARRPGRVRGREGEPPW